MSKKIESTRKKVLKLEGNLSIYEAGSLQEMFISSLEDGDLLEVDMMEVKECDTSGLQVLCSGKKTADQKGKQIILTGIPKAVEDAMIKAGITQEMIAHNGGTGCQR
jgi:anti-sigma B factor antagonist